MEDEEAGLERNRFYDDAKSQVGCEISGAVISFMCLDAPRSSHQHSIKLKRFLLLHRSINCLLPLVFRSEANKPFSFSKLKHDPLETGMSEREKLKT